MAYLRYAIPIKPLPIVFLKAGKLKNNRTIERWTLLACETAINADNYPRVVSFYGD